MILISVVSWPSSIRSLHGGDAPRRRCCDKAQSEMSCSDCSKELWNFAMTSNYPSPSSSICIATTFSKSTYISPYRHWDLVRTRAIRNRTLLMTFWSRSMGLLRDEAGGQIAPIEYTFFRLVISILDSTSFLLNLWIVCHIPF